MKTHISTLIIAALLGATSAFAHSDAIKPEFVDMLLKPYFKVQASLAGDDLATAKKNASTFHDMLGHGPSQKEAPSLETLSVEAQKIINASDIKAARSAFHAISKDLGEIVEHVGTSGKSDVVKMSCPMAFDGKGGEWLQNSNDLANPYYGSMMFKCGSVIEQLATASAEHRHDNDQHEKANDSDQHSEHGNNK